MIRRYAKSASKKAQRHIEQAKQYRQQAVIKQALGNANVQEIKDTANSQRAEAKSLNKQAKESLKDVDKALKEAEIVIAKAEEYAEEVKQLEATAASYQAMQEDKEHAVFWRAQSRDAAGRLNQVVHGNGLTTHWAYNQATGVLERVSTGLSWDPLRELEYQYDNNSNVISRFDSSNNIDESFTYDQLDRLSSSAVISPSNSHSAYNKTIDYQYDANGNITYKSDVGNYSYNGAYLTSAGNNHRNYQYDANGNITAGGGRSISWSSFNKPTHISKGNGQVDFSYDADRKRYKRVDNLDGVTTTTLYLGKTYERIQTGGDTTHKYFIYAGGQLAAAVNPAYGD